MLNSIPPSQSEPVLSEATLEIIEDLDVVSTNTRLNNAFASPDVEPVPAPATVDRSKSRATTPEDYKLIPVLGIFRLIGYSLIAFALIDLIYALIPPKFTDPVWEFQTIGDWFERVPVLMLGFVFAFYQGSDFRRKIERQLLRILSWITLPLGVCFLLLLPLCLNDAAQINRLNNAEINGQINDQIVQLEEAKKRILNASEDQLKTLLLPADKAAKIPGAPRTAQVAKDLALDNLGKAEQRGRNQAEQARQNLKRNLLKNTTRLLLGCMISSFTLFYLWKGTKWARDLRCYRTALMLPASQVKSRRAKQEAKAMKAQQYMADLPPGELPK